MILGYQTSKSLGKGFELFIKRLGKAPPPQQINKVETFLISNKNIFIHFSDDDLKVQQTHDFVIDKDKNKDYRSRLINSTDRVKSKRRSIKPSQVHQIFLSLCYSLNFMKLQAKRNENNIHLYFLDKVSLGKFDRSCLI